MRITDDDGPEYGTDWIVEGILNANLKPVDLDSDFEESVRDSYPETTTIGWMSFDTVTLMKDQDPISWDCALGEYTSHEESDEQIVTFDNGSTYYRNNNLEKFIEENSE